MWYTVWYRPTRIIIEILSFYSVVCILRPHVGKRKKNCYICIDVGNIFGIGIWYSTNEHVLNLKHAVKKRLFDNIHDWDAVIYWPKAVYKKFLSWIMIKGQDHALRLLCCMYMCVKPISPECLNGISSYMFFVIF